MEAGRGHCYTRPAPRRLSTIGWGVAPAEPVPRLDGFPTMMIMMMLPMIVGAMATLVNSWTGFIEAAFMDMTLTLEDFDYGFGPVDCGAWEECGNATFESYQRARDLALLLFMAALVVVGIKDMLKGGLGDVSLGAVDTKNPARDAQVFGAGIAVPVHVSAGVGRRRRQHEQRRAVDTQPAL